MSIQLLHYLLAYSAIFLVYLIDRNIKVMTVRDYSNLCLEFFNQIVYLSLAYFLLNELVTLISPFEILSISSLNVPIVVNVFVSFLLIDFFHYLNHRLHHQINFLWRLHRLHHSDKSVDPLTTFLHHPFEAVSSYLILIFCYLIFDIPVPVLIGYAFTQAIHAPVTHMRKLLPVKLDQLISKFIVTPNFHRIHHSLDFKESNSNYGLILTIWDKLFGTYTSVTYSHLIKMQLGISDEQSPVKNTLKNYLLNPFK